MINENQYQRIKSKNWVIWTSSYLILVTFLIEIMAYGSFEVSYIIILSTFTFALICSIWLWKRKLSKKTLYLHDVLNIALGVSLGYMASPLMAKELCLFFGYITYVAVVDFFSFTKKGAKSTNAKLMSSPNSVSRLSICLPIPNMTGLYPIIGVGDLFYYSIIIITSIMVWGKIYFGAIALSILIGQILNMILFIIFYKKKWYKGIPATVLPGLLYILTVVLKIIQ